LSEERSPRPAADTNRVYDDHISRTDGMTPTDLDLGQLRRSNVSDMAMDSLLDLIRRRVLKPGDRLPSQRDLVTRMRVSQTAVREALRGLSSIGVIDVQPGRGAFVRSVSPETVVRPESMFFLLQRESLLQAIEVRKILEVEAIALAAERATGEDLAAMKQALVAIEDGLRTNDEPFRHSPYFHLSIAKATHNAVLTNMVESFVRLLVQGAQIIGERAPDAREEEYRLHKVLFDAVVSRDPELARDRMREHLEEARRLILLGFAGLDLSSVAPEN
jgi:GntR family transcriptional repressor for pyruvate dehydrogenase complex